MKKSYLYDIIKHPLITEKSTLATEQHNKVTFVVQQTATKQQIKEAVEALFGVTVIKINTGNSKGKLKVFRGRKGQRSDKKKAIVTLKEGQSIDMTAGV